MKPSASSCSQNAGSSSGPSLGSGDAEGWPRTGNVSTAKRSLSSSSLLFASCFESYAIQDDVPGQTLRGFNVRPLPPGILPILGKLIRLLGSDQPGEVLGSVKAMGRVLSASKLDWHDLAAVLAPGRRKIGTTNWPTARCIWS